MSKKCIKAEWLSLLFVSGPRHHLQSINSLLTKTLELDKHVLSKGQVIPHIHAVRNSSPSKPTIRGI